MNQLVDKHNSETRTWINYLSVAYLLLLVLVALFADLLPLGFTYNEAQGQPLSLPPFQWQLYKSNEPFHWLGTDTLGRDLLAVLIYGTRTAFLISLPAMVLACLVGVGLGIIAGYYGDSGLKWPVGKWVALLISLFFFIFYAFGVQTIFLFGSYIENSSIFKGILLILLSGLLYIVAGFLFLKLPFLKSPVSVPFDSFLIKIIEVIGAVPRLLLVLCLAAFVEPSFWNVVIIGMLTFWPGIARLTRAEMLKQKGLPYIEAAVTLGFSPARVLAKHALPNMLIPIMVAVTFGICNLIALESTLTFLGQGLPIDTPSWGQAIKSFKENSEAWWLLLFPGLCIILVVLAIQNVNNFIIQKIQPNKTR